jgi:hypothetical protein
MASSASSDQSDFTFINIPLIWTPEQKEAEQAKINTTGIAVCVISNFCKLCDDLGDAIQKMTVTPTVPAEEFHGLANDWLRFGELTWHAIDVVSEGLGESNDKETDRWSNAAKIALRRLRTFDGGDNPENWAGLKYIERLLANVHADPSGMLNRFTDAWAKMRHEAERADIALGEQQGGRARKSPPLAQSDPVMATIRETIGPVKARQMAMVQRVDQEERRPGCSRTEAVRIVAKSFGKVESTVWAALRASKGDGHGRGQRRRTRSNRRSANKGIVPP